jgi:Ca-activated chloride channel homolog
MTKRKAIAMLFLISLFVLGGKPVNAESVENLDRSLSPYFFVQSDDPEVDRLPLKSTDVQVNISGVIADVVVTQVYKNEGKGTIEAIYVFPASTRAAVYGMKMSIGDRTIVAKIRDRKSARQEYDQAKQEGKSASLLEQQRPNVFQMNVANILPGDIVKVVLKYTELLVPEDKIYEFVYPTVIGPRYTEMSLSEADVSDTWTKNPYLHQDQPPTYSFDIKVTLAAGVPVRDIGCSSHKVNVAYEGPAMASIMLDNSEINGGNRDYILRYRLAGGKIETGLLLFEGEKENFFLLMCQPPKRISEDLVPAREYIFIVDVSGSMRGFPLETSKKLLKNLILNLNPRDKFNVLLFAGCSSVMSEKSVSATRNNISTALNFIDRQRGGGGTRLLPALQKALSLPKAEGFSQSIVIATDGYVAVETEAFEIIRNNLGHANFFTFGIGPSVNRYLIEGMARVGMGEPFIVTKPDEAPLKAEKFRKLIESPFLTEIEVNYNKFKVYDIEPPNIPDLMADRPIIVFGKWRGKAEGEIEIRGISGDRKFREKVIIGNVKSSTSHKGLKYLWARHRIAILSDYNRLNQQDDRVREITEMGLKYSLLTAYTSFVAIDSRVRVEAGKPVTVKQPLPLPQGVSDCAVGRSRSYLTKMPSINRTLRPSTSEGENSLADEKQEYIKEKKHEIKSPVKEETTKGKKITLGDIRVSGELLKEEVRSILERQMPGINKCLVACASDQGSEEKIVLKLVIDSSGRVTESVVSEGKNICKALRNCIIGELNSVSFPQMKKGKNSVIIVTFILK